MLPLTDIFLFEFSCEMSFDERRLPSFTVSNQDQLQDDQQSTQQWFPFEQTSIDNISQICNIFSNTWGKETKHSSYCFG